MNVTLFNADCLEAMKQIPDKSIDTIITDPPYGLKFMGKKWDYDVPSIDIWKECLRVLKPGGTLLCFAGSRTQHRMACNIEDSGFILKDCIMWLYGSGFPKATDISKQLDKGHKREIIGKKQHKTGSARYNKYRHGKYEYDYESDDTITAPSTDQAILWNGWKSHGLKPAYEPILVAMKSNDGTYAENALKHGVAGFNIDGGRIGTDRIKTNGRGKQNGNTPIVPQHPDYQGETHTGRFPANIILDEEAARQLDEQSVVSISTGGSGKASKNYKSDGRTVSGGCQATGGFGDKGGASRFFYCAKASKAERNKGCEELKDKSYKMHRPPDSDPEKVPMINKNNHPTVKPLKLMEYLCILTKTPTGGVVLDPFMGSGTTGIACKNTGRDFIGIELNEEYFQIAEKRIKEEK